VRVCPGCGEVPLLGPGGCACKRAAAEEKFHRELVASAAETERIIASDPELRRKLEEAGREFFRGQAANGT
jgi:hypothetical protein